MKMAIKGCDKARENGAKRHSWEFVKNIRLGRAVIAQDRSTTLTIVRKGVYRCRYCGMTKRGEPL